ncbi:MAG TPA: hypothetical protein VL984_06045 [Acidimicrobiales bacterium]|nr:hypothetical protein [Acidimicrobiales bacterium]
MPAMVKLATVDAARAHELPARATLTVVPDVEPVAVQEMKPLTRVIAGVAGMEKPVGKLAVTVPPAASAPLAELLKPTVQVVAEAPATWLEPLNETELTAVEAHAGPARTGAPRSTTASTTADLAARAAMERFLAATGDVAACARWAGLSGIFQLTFGTEVFQPGLAAAPRGLFQRAQGRPVAPVEGGRPAGAGAAELAPCPLSGRSSCHPVLGTPWVKA